MMLTSEQIRAARALLRLDQSELAARAHVSIITIRRLESATSDSRVGSETLRGIRNVLEAAGAEFIPNGVRRRPLSEDKDKLFDDLMEISRRSAAKIVDRSDFLTDDDLYDENGLPS